MADAENEAKITLGLLNAIDENAGASQRSMASDLGIALGLANAYLKRCVKKGLVKVSQAPANRYLYYLTPQGFAEKSRLTAEFLSQSFRLFRESRSQYAEILRACEARGWRRVVLWGTGDLAEIVILCARNFPVELTGAVDPTPEVEAFAELPVLPGAAPEDGVDAVIICDLESPQEAFDAARARFPAERVLAPRFLHVSERGPDRQGIAP